MRCRLLRPGQGEKFEAVLLGGLTEMRMHWVDDHTYPCTECEQCPFCPGRPDKIAYKWYGAAALFDKHIHTPSQEEVSMYNLRKRTGQACGEEPRSRYIITTTQLALAEVPDCEMVGIGEGERRGMILEWSKGRYKQSPIKVRLLGKSRDVLPDEFDWLPAAERILNGGCPIRIAKGDDPNILKLPTRKQA